MAGRRGEWEIMPLQEVEKADREGRSYLICPKHKTSKYHKELGKYISDGLWEAIRTCLGVPRRGSLFFLEPRSPETQCVWSEKP